MSNFFKFVLKGVRTLFDATVLLSNVSNLQLSNYQMCSSSYSLFEDPNEIRLVFNVVINNIVLVCAENSFKKKIGTALFVNIFACK